MGAFTNPESSGSGGGGGGGAFRSAGGSNAGGTNYPTKQELADEKKTSKGFLSKALSVVKHAAADLKETTLAVPRIPGALLKTATEIPQAAKALYGSGHIPFTPYKPGEEEAINKKLGKVAPHVASFAHGEGQTIRDIGGKRFLAKQEREKYTEDTGKRFSEHPFSALLNDVANLAPVAKGASAVADAAEATQGTKAASALSKVSRGADTVMNAPVAPYKALFKIPGTVGRLSQESLDRAAAEGGRASKFAGAGVRLSEGVQHVKDEMSKVTGQTEHARHAADKIQDAAQKVLPDVSDHQAAVLVGEGAGRVLADTRAAMEKAGTAGGFDAWVQDHFGLDPEVAHRAADIVEGKNEELGAKVTEVNNIYRRAAEARGLESVHGTGRATEAAKAASEHLRTVAADLRHQGLDDSASLLEDASNQIAQSEEVGRLFGGSDEEVKGEKPKLAKFDRTAEGVNKTILGHDTGKIRQASADRITTSPLATRLGEGKLSEATTSEEVRQANMKPMPHIGPTGSVSPGTFSKDAVFVPAAVADEFVSYFRKAHGADLAKIVGIGNRPFYIARLALNPAFITGRVLGHAMLGFAATSSPKELATNLIREVSHWKKTGQFRALEHEGGEQLIKSAATTAEQNRLESFTGEGKLGTMNKALNRVTKQPFRLAGFMDNVERSAFFMTELGKRGSAEQALTASLRALGDFNRMTPFERQTVAQFIPMFAWHKELTRIAFHLAEDHPLRVAWTLHLADTIGQSDSPLSDFNQATLPIGGKLLGTGLLNPFAEVTDSLGGGLGGLGSLLGPVPRLAANKITNTNVSTGKEWFMPPGTGKTQGRANGPSVVHQLANLAPQNRLFQGLTGKDTVVRYANGKPFLLTENGKVSTAPAAGGRLESLSSFLGVPITSKKLAESEQADAEARAEAGASNDEIARINEKLKQTAKKLGLPYHPVSNASGSSGGASSTKKKNGGAFR